MAGLGLLAGCALPVAGASASRRDPRESGSSGVARPDALNAVMLAAFRQGLQAAGYVEDQSLHIDQAHANSDGQFAEPAAALVRLRPELIVVPSGTDARSVLSATATIPIVCAGNGDLVGAELAASYARPGGTVTGLSTPLLAGKQLQLLQETVPTLSRVAVLFDPVNAGLRREPFEAAARRLGLQLQWTSAVGPDDLRHGL